MKCNIIYYKDNNNNPIQEFIDSQPPKVRVKIFRNLQLLAEFGVNIGYPLVSNMGNNLWELRTVFQGNQYRIIFSVVSGKIILLIHGFHKKTQKIAKADIELAASRLKNYLSKGGY